MNDIQKFMAVMVLIDASPFNKGLCMADSEADGGYVQATQNKVLSAMNSAPNGTEAEILTLVMNQVKNSLGISLN